MATFRVLSVCYVVLIVIGCIPNIANAFSLGELQVLSKPDQAFQAAAAVKLGKDENITTVETGSSSDYALLNLPYTDEVNTLTATVKKQDGKPFIWLQGTDPIHVNNFYVLLRVSSNHHTYFPFFQVRYSAPVTGKKETIKQDKKKLSEHVETITKLKTTKAAVKEDPVVDQNKNKKQNTEQLSEQTATIAKAKDSTATVKAESVVPTVDAESYTPEAQPLRKASKTKDREADIIPSPNTRQPRKVDTVPLTNKELSTVEETYGPVSKGETLTAIARKFKNSPSTSIFQVMNAIVERNPDHFISNNMNGLKAGSKLVIPTQKEISRIDNHKARKLRLTHALEWRKTLTGQVADQDVLIGDQLKRPEDQQKLVNELTLPEKPSVVVVSSTAKEEGPHTEDFGMFPTKFPDQYQNKNQSAKHTREENGNLKAILGQLQVITRVLENNQERQERFEQRISLLEESKKEWDILQERVNSLEIAKDALPYPLPTIVEEEDPQRSPQIKETWLLWGGIAVTGLGLFVGVLVLWLGRRWNRADHWNNLRALLAATAQKDPELLKNALQETEPAFDKEFLPTVYNQKLEGISPQLQKHSVASNPEATANRLKMMDQKNS